jgi:Tol biopolymer transport system component
MLNVDPERVHKQLARILASPAFADAERARRFLRFVVERRLEGRDGEIKESVIAIEVLGRNASFDSKSDSIVRVEAGRLRDRLGAYYEAEGGADPILISLPKGRYIPEFTERRPAQSRGAGVLRLSVLPPEKAMFESFAVSPDGRTLAFTAALNGRMTLWVRALDSLEAKPVAGTNDASWPFWSPDSRSIGFFAPNKLKAVEISGGPPREIADILMGKGAAWSPEGVILFGARPLGPLYQVSDAGSPPVPVTSLDDSRAEIVHGFPQFLPDGRHFLYLAAGFRPDMSSIRAGSLDSPGSKVLVTADTSGAYAPVLTGHVPSLLYVHDGALIAQPFDWQTLELSEERTVVVPQIQYRRWNQARFSVSSKGVLLYQAGCAENLELTWFDRLGKCAPGPRNDYFSIRISPDERYVAVHRHDDPDTVLPTIWVIDLLREGAIFRITDADLAVSEFSAVWARDASEILFSRGDDRRMRLFRRALSGGAASCVLDTEGPKFPTDWSPDGQFVAYDSQVPDYRNLHIWVATLGGGEEEAKARPFLKHSCQEVNAEFSPADANEAARWVAYASNETGRFEIYVRDFPGGNHKWQVSSQGGLQPHWRRDGRELFYLSLDGILMSVAVNPAGYAGSPTFESGPSQPLFATGLRFLTLYSVWMNQYGVSADGQRFLVNRPVQEAAQGVITAVIPW